MKVNGRTASRMEWAGGFIPKARFIADRWKTRRPMVKELTSRETVQSIRVNGKTTSSMDLGKKRVLEEVSMKGNMRTE